MTIAFIFTAIFQCEPAGGIWSFGNPEPSHCIDVYGEQRIVRAVFVDDILGEVVAEDEEGVEKEVVVKDLKKGIKE
jgi:hypothetical protein